MPAAPSAPGASRDPRAGALYPAVVFAAALALRWVSLTVFLGTPYALYPVLDARRYYEWALAIEQCLGGLVNSFICENYEDERLMHQLLSRYVRNPNQRPRVLVNKDFNRPLHDVTRYVSLSSDAWIDSIVWLYF